MGSISEDELLQMVRDFIESESASPISPPSSNTMSHNDQHPYLTLQEIIRRATKVEVDVLEKILVHVKEMGIAREPTLLKKRLVARLKIDGYEASLCKTYSVCNLGRSKGDYEYIDVMVGDGNGDGKPERLIVDMDFRSHFEVARPTPTYKELTDAIPTVFVGTEEKLKKIISLLCKAAKESLRERGLHIPPWRKASYMQSKWLSKDYKKVSVPITNMD
ncbi:hypothetical protein F2P56_012011 [Juglans regia]|uniref:Uncharacterized protein LOC108987371 isoform X2 n=2 Tax=Juglans regia TaxID=51240 RepID=A0A2I4E8U7_JUGRE|nr:uncharacterized protein LOC108987371 isoform X2 [Juglans regia]KAF5467796.1 hypothetical protein F2P56_012011 [Juglans regia]